MPISQSEIFGSIKKPDDTDAAVTSVTFTLSGSDFEGPEWIAANTVRGTVVTEEGNFRISLWPNDRGVNGDTMYSASLQFADGSSVTMPSQMRVAYSPVPRSIGQLMFESRTAAQIAPNRVQVLTRAEFDALLNRTPNTAYLIVRDPVIPAPADPEEASA